MTLPGIVSCRYLSIRIVEKGGGDNAQRGEKPISSMFIPTNRKNVGGGEKVGG